MFQFKIVFEEELDSNMRSYIIYSNTFSRESHNV